jgi:hypothetical protein
LETDGAGGSRLRRPSGQLCTPELAFQDDCTLSSSSSNCLTTTHQRARPAPTSTRSLGHVGGGRGSPGGATAHSAANSPEQFRRNCAEPPAWKSALRAALRRRLFGLLSGEFAEAGTDEGDAGGSRRQHQGFRRRIRAWPCSAQVNRGWRRILRNTTSAVSGRRAGSWVSSSAPPRSGQAHRCRRCLRPTRRLPRMPPRSRSS